MARTGVIRGKDIMVYCALDAQGKTFKPTAAATSHKISYKAESKSNKRITKDADASMWESKQVTGLSCQIQVSCLVDVTASNMGYKEMLAAYKLAKPVKCKYSYTAEASGDSFEEGMFVITNIDQDASADGDATWSCTLESDGAVETKPYTAG